MRRLRRSYGEQESQEWASLAENSRHSDAHSDEESECASDRHSEEGDTRTAPLPSASTLVATALAQAEKRLLETPSKKRAAAKQQPDTLAVTVPETWRRGDMLAIDSPCGQQLRVHVPAGAEAGDTLEFDLPSKMPGLEALGSVEANTRYNRSSV
jgi:hypothetical protein